MTKRQSEKIRLAAKNRRQGALVALGRAALKYVAYHYNCGDFESVEKCALRPVGNPGIYDPEFRAFLNAAKAAVNA